MRLTARRARRNASAQAGAPSSPSARLEGGDPGSGEDVNDVDPSAMFEPMYGAAAEGREVLRWDCRGPHPLIDEWARDVCGAGRRAMIVGCGFGTDAELFAQRGFDVVAFDVSPTAIAAARQRFAQSSVDYHIANLLEAPSQWNQASDLVLESLTVQSMPTRFTRTQSRTSREWWRPAARCLSSPKHETAPLAQPTARGGSGVTRPTIYRHLQRHHD